MAILPVLRLPEGVLSKTARPLVSVDGVARALAGDLVDTMRASPGCVGLAAPQIGVGLRCFVLDVTGHPKARSCSGEVVLFNPEVLIAEGSLTGREGCMSVPDLTGDVARASRVVVRGLSLDGRQCTVEADAFEARAVLHEVDHLDGLVFLDRLMSSDRVFPRKVYR